MKLQIAARHMQLTGALRAHVRERFLGAMPRHYDRAACWLHVELDHEVGEGKHRFEVVRAQLSIPGAQFVAQGRARDLYAAIDATQLMLLRQLDDHRKRLICRAHHRKASRTPQRLA